MVIPLIPVLQKQLLNKRFMRGFFLCILLFDGFLYMKWAAASGSKLYTCSVQLGEILPPNAVLAGCWSSDLVIENGRRALILQEDMAYNKDTLMRFSAVIA